MAKIFWRIMIGKDILEDSDLQRYFGRWWLAKIFWKMMIGELFWRMMIGKDILEDDDWQRYFGGWWLAKIFWKMMEDIFLRYFGGSWWSWLSLWFWWHKNFPRCSNYNLKFSLPRFQTTALSAAPSTIQAHDSLSGVENKKKIFLKFDNSFSPFSGGFSPSNPGDTSNIIDWQGE